MLLHLQDTPTLSTTTHILQLLPLLLYLAFIYGYQCTSQTTESRGLNQNPRAGKILSKPQGGAQFQCCFSGCGNEISTSTPGKQNTWIELLHGDEEGEFCSLKSMANVILVYTVAVITNMACMYCRTASKMLVKSYKINSSSFFHLLHSISLTLLAQEYQN